MNLHIIGAVSHLQQLPLQRCIVAAAPSPLSLLSANPCEVAARGAARPLWSPVSRRRTLHAYLHVWRAINCLFCASPRRVDGSTWWFSSPPELQSTPRSRSRSGWKSRCSGVQLARLAQIKFVSAHFARGALQRNLQTVQLFLSAHFLCARVAEENR